MRYPYADPEVLAGPKPYSYAPCAGTDFIAAYFRSRQEAVATFRRRAGAVAPAVSAAAPEETVKRLRDFETEHGRKKLTPAELTRLHAAGSGEAGADLRILSALLKVGDALCAAGAGELTPEAAASAAESLEREMAAVAAIEHRIGLR